MTRDNHSSHSSERLVPTRMKCVICQYGETEPGTTTVALTRDDTTIVISDVPALICSICGEEYVDAATGRRLSEIAEKAALEGVQVDVRRYQAA
jgi:YgiT-type zinc finger domain-containing protein